MNTVRSLLNQKGYDVWGVAPDVPVMDAIKILHEKNIGAILIKDGEKILGIFSERDLARKTAVMGTCVCDQMIKDVMTDQVFFVSPAETIDQCMALMTEKHIRHLPVVEKDKVIGMISIGDVVKMTISQKEVTIKSLENYILGREFSPGS